MPLHDVGYRGWTGDKSSPWSRWLVVAFVGVQLALRSNWLSRTLIVGWIPAIGIGVCFFLYEQSLVVPQLREGIANLVAVSSGDLELARTVIVEPEAVRQQVWATLMLFFFRYPQAILMVIVVGIVSPRLISYDLRNRGYLLYFSRPVQIVEYILGKGFVICFFLGLITTLPAMLLYIVGVFLSPQVDVILLTWDLPLRICAASLVLMIPIASVALACSAMTIESRYATFAWFALWIVGWVCYSVLSVGERIGNGMPRRRARGEFAAMEDIYSRWELVSPYHLLGRVQQWVFGLYPEERAIWPFMLVLAAITSTALVFVYRQLRSRLHS